MIKRVKSIILQNKVVIENFSFLGFLQISNLIIFFLMIPFLFRILGKENYGLVAFAQTTALYFSMVINYGFNATATRDISVNRDEKSKRSQIISSVITIKIFLFVVSVSFLFVLFIFIPLLRSHLLLFLFSMLACLSEALFPIWYFQGIEKMKYITFINVVTRVISAIIIFIVINDKEDYFLVPLILGTGLVIGAFAGLFVLFKLHDNRFLVPPFSDLKMNIKTNFPVFISNLSSQIYANSNKLVIGAVMGVKDLAIYDVVDRIVNLLKVPLYVIGQALFPEISRKRKIRYINNAMLMVLFFYLFVFVIVFFLAPYISHLMIGEKDHLLITTLRVLSVTIIPVTLSLFYTDLRLVPFEFYTDYAKTRVFSLVIYAILILVMTLWIPFTITSFAWVVLIVEIFVVFTALFFCFKREIC